MAKRLKQKICRVIPSFQSCRSKDPSTLPSNPVPLFFRLRPVNSNPIDLRLPPPPPPSSSKPHHPSVKRHLSSAFTSIGCGFRSRSSSRYLSETGHTSVSPPTSEFLWEKQDKWHVVAKIYDESTPRRKVYTSSISGESQNNDIFLPPPPPPNTEKKIRRVRKKKTVPRLRISTSSAESGLFSSEGLDDDDDGINDEETETLVSSSRSFSTDYSSELNPRMETIRESPFKHRRKKKKKHEEEVKHGRRRYGKAGTRTKRRKSYELASTSPARLSRFQWLIPCRVEGKVRESFAVVKKSEDPHEDFKRSMMEMIMEKEMFEERDLEQLLQCFLSLNSRYHHGVIVQAFAEIWDALFCSSRTSVTHRPRVSTTF